MSGANASPTGRSQQRMTAHDFSIRRTADSGSCAVIDRAYSCSDALRAILLLREREGVDGVVAARGCDGNRSRPHGAADETRHGKIVAGYN